LLLFAGVVLACAGIATAAWYWTRPDQTPPPPPESKGDSPPPDPRVAFATPFRNVKPEVKYVGDAECARCHRQIAHTFHQHPMGRSAEWVGRGPSTVDHAAGPNNPLTASGYELRVEKKGDRVWHRVGLAGEKGTPAYEVSADLAIGSGTHGRSYLTVDRGAVWQSPISWFTQAGKWDVSPGFDLGKELRRPVVAQCLHCHTDRPEPVRDSLNRYREPFLPVQASIGCERCHGPGELHVAERADGNPPPIPDYSIVNPAHLDADLKADVCRQCHLQGADRVPRRGRELAEYRPGLPWEQFASVFVRHPDLTDYRKSVGQFEQMEASRCFAGSKGKLSCVSCHDPHAKPAAAETAAYFRAKCLACHQERGCTEPEAKRREKQDSCVACHMPARDSSNVVHVAVTDHRIMKKPDEGTPRAKVLAMGQMPLVAYRAGPHAPAAEERERDLMIALGNEFARGGTSPDRWQVVAFKLDESLKRWPADATGWVVRSRMHLKHDGDEAGLAAARRAVEARPDSEAALAQLAGAAVAADDNQLAIETATKLIALNPSSADHLLTRASAHLFRDWEKAEADCRAALAIQPVHANARFLLALCRHHRGDPAGSRTEFDLAIQLTPDAATRKRFTEWYEQLPR
jgi:hypothetical protein